MKMQTLAVAFMCAVTIGGLAWVFLYPLLSGEKKAEKRRESFARPEPTRRIDRSQQRSRREQVEETLKEVEQRHKKAKDVQIATRIAQAGLSLSTRQFFIGSAGLGIACFALPYLFGVALLPAVVFGLAAGLGLPRWILGFLKKRREQKFIDALPDAVDVIVRGIKAGLPLFD